MAIGQHGKKFSKTIYKKRRNKMKIKKNFIPILQKKNKNML